MQTKTVKILLILIPCFFAYNANACECSITTFAQNFKSTDYVVKVKVIALKDTVHYNIYSNPIYPPFKTGFNTILKVQKNLKGKLTEKRIKVTGNGSMYDFYFNLNEEYVVFLDLFKGRFITSVCKYNFLFKDKKALQNILKLSKEVKKFNL